MLQKFDALKNNPIDLTRAMLDFGQGYLPLHEKIEDHGGVHKLHQYYEERAENDQKMIDKLKGEIVKLKDNLKEKKDYITNGVYSIPTKNQTGSARGNSIGALLDQARTGR